MIIAVDWDGTVVTHNYPGMGEDIGAFPWLKQWQEAGALLILLTMRDGQELKAAIDYAASNGIKFWAVNENPTQKTWTVSPKVYAHLYIDDLGFGIPLIQKGGRPYVDWKEVGPKVLELINDI